jgi:hypothetical protein
VSSHGTFLSTMYTVLGREPGIWGAELHISRHVRGERSLRDLSPGTFSTVSSGTWKGVIIYPAMPSL